MHAVCAALGFTQARCVFTSDRDEFSARCVWAKLRGRENVLLAFVVADGTAFFSFHATVPAAQNTPTVDPDHRAFVVAPDGATTRLTAAPTQRRCLAVYGDQSTCVVLSVAGFCDLRTDGRSWLFDDRFPDYSPRVNYADAAPALDAYRWPRCFAPRGICAFELC